MNSPVVRLAGVEFGWHGDGPACLALDAFELQAGERVFLSGPSGSGKSTLLSLIAGVALPRRGVVELLGHDLSAMSGGQRDRMRAANVGFVFQLFNLLPYLSVLDNVLLPCRFSRERAARIVASGSTAPLEARRLLGELDLPPALLHQAAADLSVGQQQRVAAARALIGRPALVIADEPTSALDAPLQRAFLDLLLGEARAANSAVLFVSHDGRLAEGFDRIVSLPSINRAAAAQPA